MSSFVHETSSLPVNRHHAGNSTSTVESVESISNSPPGSSGSMCLRIREEQSAAAVQVAPVEAGVRLVDVLLEGIHQMSVKIRKGTEAFSR